MQHNCLLTLRVLLAWHSQWINPEPRHAPCDVREEDVPTFSKLNALSR